MIRLSKPFREEIIQIYSRESKWILLLDAVTVGIITIGYASSIGSDPNAGYYRLYLPVCLMLYALMSMTLFHRVAILLHFDLARKDIVCVSGQVESISHENSWVFRFGESFVTKFYPKVEDVRRYRIYYIDADGKRGFARTVMSHTKWFLMFQLFLDVSPKPMVKLEKYKRSDVLTAIGFQDEELQDKNAIKNLQKFGRHL